MAHSFDFISFQIQESHLWKHKKHNAEFMMLEMCVILALIYQFNSS